MANRDTMMPIEREQADIEAEMELLSTAIAAICGRLSADEFDQLTAKWPEIWLSISSDPEANELLQQLEQLRDQEYEGVNFRWCCIIIELIDLRQEKLSTALVRISVQLDP